MTKISSFIHPKKYLLRASSVPSTVLGAGNATVNKTGTTPLPSQSLHSSGHVNRGKLQLKKLTNMEYVFNNRGIWQK